MGEEAAHQAGAINQLSEVINRMSLRDRADIEWLKQELEAVKERLLRVENKPAFTIPDLAPKKKRGRPKKTVKLNNPTVLTEGSPVSGASGGGGTPD